MRETMWGSTGEFEFGLTAVLGLWLPHLPRAVVPPGLICHLLVPSLLVRGPSRG